MVKFTTIGILLVLILAFVVFVTNWVVLARVRDAFIQDPNVIPTLKPETINTLWAINIGLTLIVAFAILAWFILLFTTRKQREEIEEKVTQVLNTDASNVLKTTTKVEEIELDNL